jgi:hypothetical protein
MIFFQNEGYFPLLIKKIFKREKNVGFQGKNLNFAVCRKGIVRCG